MVLLIFSPVYAKFIFQKISIWGVLKSTVWCVYVGGWVGVRACSAVVGGGGGTRPDPAAAGSVVSILDMIVQLFLQPFISFYSSSESSSVPGIVSTQTFSRGRALDFLYTSSRSWEHIHIHENNSSASLLEKSGRWKWRNSWRAWLTIRGYLMFSIFYKT